MEKVPVQSLIMGQQFRFINGLTTYKFISVRDAIEGYDAIQAIMFSPLEAEMTFCVLVHSPCNVYSIPN